jgi:ATP-binding cassette subfamily B protein
LLDEATASLDVENETKIQDGISALIRTKPFFIIAHRIRTIANAHKIVVLKNGQIEEMGSPDELKKQKRTFYRMLRAQIQSV